MRARRNGWEPAGREAFTALLALALFLQAALSGRDALRAAAPAFDPASVICAAHPGSGGADVPDGGNQGPAAAHDFCCALLCGAGNAPPPALPPATGPILLPPARLGPALTQSADGCPGSRRHCTRHGARAPPVPA